MQSIHRFFERLFALGAGLSMALVFGIIFINSLRRYTVGKSLEWGEELPIYLTVYGVMFGIGFAYLQNRHIRFTIVTDLLSDRLRRMLYTAGDGAVVLIGISLTWSGIVFAGRRGDVEASGLIGSAKAMAEASGIEGLVLLGQMGTYQSAIAVGGIILTIAALLRLWTQIREAK
ncbi:MAG: TRAP transporter small permease subunit [Alphaproteobacteria bacterium]|uniref:TRAP transporter small permease n=1 Tax=Pacificispira sp. TaxID=2888761 RepID=UPI002EAAD2DA|nr:TRAP transporter small permease subunit [Pseudomonadota bacterium]